MENSGGKGKSVVMMDEAERLRKELERFKVMLRDAEEGEMERESVKLWLQQLKGVISDAEDRLDGEGEKHMPSMEKEVDATTAHGGGKDMSAIEVERLQKELIRFKALLQYAEQGKVKSEVFKLWLQQLKDVIYDAEDLLDEFEYEDLRRRVEHRSFQKTGERSSPCVSVVPFDPRILARRLDEIWRRFEEVEKDNQTNSNLKHQMGDQSSKLDDEVKESSSFLIDPKVYGRDETKSEIIRMLTEENTEGGESSSSVESGGLPVICVTGMGGVGKTTLAQYVYNDAIVRSHFALSMWVHVSPAFDVAALTKKVLEHVGGPQNVKSLDVLQKWMSERLKDKRFLLVLDDMWEERHDKWSTFIAPLVSVAESGSRILVTTRNMGVADAVGSVKNISLEPLTFDDSWLIFKRHAFPDGESDDVKYSELQYVGKRIVQKLKGHPLAASTIGGLLRSESDKYYWSNIMDSKLWELEPENDGILPALRISYEYLPPELKPCFTYACVFHKGREFEIIDLVQFWMAQGYLSPKQKMSMEDVGIRYLDKLIKRSLIQFVNGRYVVHDLLHDLGKHILQNDCYEIGPNEITKIPVKTNSIRHLYVDYHRSFYENLQVVYKFKHLRTLSFCFSEFGYVQFSQTPFSEIKHLKVLDLSGSTLVSLPESIGFLISLRYLDLRDTKIKILPDSLCTLYKLQTLKLTGCDELSTLPKYIGNLVNLHYLEVRSELVCNISRIENLTRLQCLEVFSVSKEVGNKISALKMMNDLRGELRITNLQNVDTKEESVEAALKEKQHLNVLEMVWAKDRDVNQIDPSFEESIVDGLEPPNKLKRLVLDGYIGFKVPNWMINGSMSMLQSLHLINCPNLDKLPRLEGMKCIKLLSIESCNQLKELPQLPQTIKALHLQDVGLTALPNNLHGLTLEKLILRRISKLVEQPYLLLPVTLKELTLSELPLKFLPKFYLGSGYHHEQITASTDEDQISNYEPPELLVLRISNCQELTTLHDGILKHHMKHLQELSVVNCRELMDWPKGDAFRATMHSLRGELTLENCAKLKALPEGIELHPSLKKLRVRGCPKISNKSLFSQMQNLASSDVSLWAQYENLQSYIEEALQQPFVVDWLLITCSDEAIFSPYILSVDYSRVKIYNPKQRAEYQARTLRLRMKNFSPQLLHACLDGRHARSPSVRRLDLDGIPDNAFSGDRQHHVPPIPLPSLETLAMWNCTDMRTLPSKMLLSGSPALHVLALDNCPELTLSSIVEGIRSIPSLVRLEIHTCPKLELGSSNDDVGCWHKKDDTLPSCLPKLKEIRTDNAKLLTWLPPRDDADKNNNSVALFRGHIIGSLRKLTLRRSGVSFLSTAEEEGLTAVATSLQFLSFRYCKDLKELPANLKDLVPNLELLFIVGCPCIQRLPVGGFPTSLEVLAIEECPDLAEWCYRQQEDVTIRRIPVVEVGGRFLQGTYVQYMGMRAKWDFDL